MYTLWSLPCYIRRIREYLLDEAEQEPDRGLGQVPVDASAGKAQVGPHVCLMWSGRNGHVRTVLVVMVRWLGFAVSRLFWFLCELGCENLKFLPGHLSSGNQTPLGMFRLGFWALWGLIRGREARWGHFGVEPSGYPMSIDWKFLLSSIFYLLTFVFWH